MRGTTSSNPRIRPAGVCTSIRRSPFAVFEHGTRIYAPSPAEDCYRVVTTDPEGVRLSQKFAREAGARLKAREYEAFLARGIPLAGHRAGQRTVGALAWLYLSQLKKSRSLRYHERQESLLRLWVLPDLADVPVTEWSPVRSEAVLTRARAVLAPESVRGVGSAMRSLVTFAYKSKWLPKEVDPMWLVSYSPKAEFQGQALGFIPRNSLPDDSACQELFAAMAEMGQGTWALAMALAHRSGARWGELVALTPKDIEFEPYRTVHIHRAVEQSSAGRRIKATKNSQKRSSIFPSSLSAALAEHVERVLAERGDHGLLFCLPDGSLAERTRFRRLWLEAASRARWPMRSSTVAQWRPHDLRHVAACWMLFDLKLDAAVVARMLGHSNPAFTLARYVGVRSGADAATNAATEAW
jgi:integrase